MNTTLPEPSPGWTLLPLKRIASLRYGLGQPPAVAEGGAPLVRATNVKRGKLVMEGLIHVDPSGIPPGRDARLRAGEIIVVRSGAYTGDSALVTPEFEGAIAGYDLVVRITTGLPRFYAWQLLGTHVVDHQFGMARSRAAQPHLNAEELGETLVYVPPLAEQEALAGLLDRETARIDALIEKQKQLAALAEEKRRAVTAHTLTRGLRQGVPLRDSGVAWIGAIPEHWKVVRLRHVAVVQSGLALGRKTDGETVEVPYLRVANVQDGFLDLTEIKTVAATSDELRRHALRPGDVLMNEGGDNDKLGRGAIWHGEVKPCIHQNHVFAVRPHGVEPEWLTMVTGSDYAKRFFESRAKQTTNLASISSSNLREVPVVMPPPEERTAILHHSKQHNAALDALRAKAKEAIALLREHRAALITAAVTGQMDVRVPALTLPQVEAA